MANPRCGSDPSEGAPCGPEDIAVALGVSSTRLEILRALAELGQATQSELAAVAGRTRNGLGPHLAALEGLGAVRHEVASVAGCFRPTRVFRLDASRVEEIAWALFDAVGGDQRVESAVA